MKYDEGLIICIFNNGTWGRGKVKEVGLGNIYIIIIFIIVI